MSRKIATPAAVFAACEALEEAGKPWNRDDVRHAVGGGGYSVIDPLIQAWRKINPIKAIAPTTPTDLLHVLAESIESHLSQYIRDVEQRDNERLKAFENSALSLSERINDLELKIQQQGVQLDAAESEKLQLQSKNGEYTEKIAEVTQTNAKRLAECDELRGSIQRLEVQFEEAKSSHMLELSKQTDQHHEQINAIKSDYQQQLTLQKNDLIKSNEQSENRLMRLIEQERSSSKQQLAELQKRLDEANQQGAKLSEKNTALILDVKRTETELHMLKKTLESKENRREMDELTSTLKVLTEKISDLENAEN